MPCHSASLPEIWFLQMNPTLRPDDWSMSGPPRTLLMYTLADCRGARLQADDAVAGVEPAGPLARPGGLPQRPAAGDR